MSHDQRLHPATDQYLLSADDSSYLQCTIREDQGFREPSWFQDVESYPDDSANDFAQFYTAPPHTSNDSSWSSINPHTREVPSFASQHTNDVIIDPPYPNTDPNQQHTEDLLDASDPALQDNDAWGRTSAATIVHPYEVPKGDLLSLPNARQGTHWADSGRHAAQIQNPEHPWLSYVGAQSGQPYPVSMDESRVSVTPSIARQLGNIQYFGSDGHTRHMAVSTSECSSVATYEPSSDTALPCSAAGCNVIFRGEYRKGNLARHKRHYHNGPRVYICEDDDCDRVFRRQDARINHYRKFHPHLTSGPAFSRKSHRCQNEYDIGGNTREAGAAMVESLSSMSPLQYVDSGTVDMDTTPSGPTVVTSGPSTEALRKDGDSVQCDICQKEFNRAAELRRHKDSVHNLNPPQYFCEVPGCDRASRPFPRKDKLADHTARVHTQSTASAALAYGKWKLPPRGTYPCDYSGCERVFERRIDLSRHQRTHLDPSDRPHKCAQCERKFLYPKDLKRHQAIHSHNEHDEKPAFHCEVASCEYGPGKQGFTRKDGMLRHMRRRHPELVMEKEES